MAPKKDVKGGSKKAATTPGKSKGTKAKKKKWSKGKTREKLNNAVYFSAETHAKLLKEVPSMRLITPARISEVLKVNGSLARQALNFLESQGKIKMVSKHRSQLIYTRSVEAAK